MSAYTDDEILITIGSLYLENLKLQATVAQLQRQLSPKGANDEPDGDPAVPARSTRDPGSGEEDIDGP